MTLHIITTEKADVDARPESVARVADGLPTALRGHPWVAGALERLEHLEVVERKQRLEQATTSRDRKAYLQAIDRRKFHKLSYDDVLADVGTLGPHLGTLYLHVPFCTKKCSYCHYYKELGATQQTIDEFWRLFLAELALLRGRGAFERFTSQTVHFGGGTPSLLSNEQWAPFMTALGEYVQLDGQTEIAIEADPEDIDLLRTRAWRSAGINRVSLGIQSFDVPTIRLLKRPHDGPIAREAYRCAVEAGFVNVNIDLMYGFPGRTWASWITDLEQILDLQPESVTIYQTRPNPTDSLERARAFPSPLERILGHQVAMQTLMAHGYMQYSPNQFIKSYQGACIAKRERNRCRAVLGVGPHAHSILGSWYYENNAGYRRYGEHIEAGETCPLKGGKMNREAEKIRYLQFGIKLSGVDKPDDDNGILKGEYFESFGERIEDDFGEKIGLLVEQGLVVDTPAYVRLTELGALLTREVVHYLGPDPA